MSPIPGEPHADKPPELTMSDGRKIKLKIPGLAPLGSPSTAGRPADAEPAGDDQRVPAEPDPAP